MTNPIPTDWKQTKLGKIPLEWWNGKIQDLVNEQIIEKPIDGNHGNVHPKSSDFVESGIPFVMANDIINESLCLAKTSKIKKEQADNLQKGFSYAGDVLFTHKGSVGSTAIVPELETDYIMLTPQVTYYRVRDQKKLDPIFLRKLFQSTRFQSLLVNLSGGGTRAYIGITAQRELPFYYSPLLEQHRIVAVLETWDKFIKKLTKTIELQKNIKKGLMKELLTGEKRLQGFSGEWHTVKLGDIGTVRTSSVDKKSVEGERKVSLLNYMDVYRRDHIFQTDDYQTVTAKDSQILSSKLNQGDVLFTPSSETPIDIGHSAVVMEDLEDIVFSYHLMRFRPKEETLSHHFSAYCFKTLDFYRELWKKAQGATRFTLSKDALEQSKITIPKSKEEQTAIARLLTTADDKITALEKKKKIIEDQRKYLLNNLITGQIRTPENLTMSK